MAREGLAGPQRASDLEAMVSLQVAKEDALQERGVNPLPVGPTRAGRSCVRLVIRRRLRDTGQAVRVPPLLSPTIVSLTR